MDTKKTNKNKALKNEISRYYKIDKQTRERVDKETLTSGRNNIIAGS